MATVCDVAKYILNQLGEMTAMKLQKLVYYSQAWSLVWDEKPLFDEPIEAWANGPVVSKLYDVHKGQFKVDKSTLKNIGNISKLSDSQKETIDAVLDFYGDKSTQWLIELSNTEAPWVDARREAGLEDGDRGWSVITDASMHEYYSGLIQK
jgi:uncharacterized phage-associated protein